MGLLGSSLHNRRHLPFAPASASASKGLSLGGLYHPRLEREARVAEGPHLGKPGKALGLISGDFFTSLIFLCVFGIPCFFSLQQGISLLFLGAFRFFPRDFEGSEEGENPCFFGFPCFSLLHGISCIWAKWGRFVIFPVRCLLAYGDTALKS